MRGERLLVLDVELLTRWKGEQPHASGPAAFTEDPSLTRRGVWGAVVGISGFVTD